MGKMSYQKAKETLIRNFNQNKNCNISIDDFNSQLNDIVGKENDPNNKKKLERLVEFMLYKKKETIKFFNGYNKTCTNQPNTICNICKFVKYYESEGRKDLTNLKKSLSKDINFEAELEAAWEGEDGQLFLKNVLLSKLKSRLRTQDRTSGDKIWLPLRFIAKLYSIDKKQNDKNKATKKDNSFLTWLNDLTNSIYIQYLDQENKIQSINIGNVDWIRLCPDNDNYIVRVKPQEGEEHYVLTPTGKGNNKEKMVVSSISDIAIDHIIPIDTTLRKLGEGEKLYQLKIVSDHYKYLQELEDYNEETVATNFLNKINLTELINELKLIGNDSPLRLMHSKYNSNKSNSETFQRIIKDYNNTYWGVINDNGEFKDFFGNTIYLYQKLTDNFTNEPILATKNIHNGTDTNNLQEIINFI